MPHKDPVAAQTYNREYKRANRWRYRPRSKIYDATKHANDRAARFGVEGRLTTDHVERILGADRCHHCGGPGPFELDHLVPMDKGGPNAVENIVASCGPCNKSKQQAPAPWRWSRAQDACRDCGSSERRHMARGLCTRCYQARVKRGADLA